MAGVEDQNMPPQNIPLWHKDDFEKQEIGEALITEQNFHFVREVYIYKEISIFKDISLSEPEEDDS